MIPMPQIDIACVARSGGLMSSITVCESGLMKAANMPCKIRNSTISSRLIAVPHSIEAMTKPPIAIRNRLREPSRSLSQPVAGSAIAVAMM